MLLFGSCLFFFDVLIRRVSLNFTWVMPAAVRLRDRLTGRQLGPVTEPFIQRLSTRKAEIAEQIEQRKAAARFEPEPSATIENTTIQEQLPASPAAESPKPATQGLGSQIEADQESYTS